MQLENKVAVVTGAARGIGQAVCQVFAAEGAQVVAMDLDAGAAEETVATLEGPNAEKSFGLAIDVSSEESVETAFDTVAERTTGAEVLVTCAGIRAITPPLEQDMAEWDKMMDVNLRGTFMCCRAAGRQMVGGGSGGSMVTISSTAGITGNDVRPAYTASKAGVVGITRSLARDLGPEGIRVNCIAPGLTRTPFTEVFFESEAVRKYIPHVVPLGHAATPENIATAILFLASDMAAYVSGVILPVDGGHTIVAGFSPGGDEESPFSKTRSLDA